MSYEEIYGDLFNNNYLDESFALAHCVGNDFIMGKGIATEFKRRYRNEEWLLENNKGIGTSLLLKCPFDNGKFQYIFYMVTKQYSKTSKPTYQTIENSIIDMFRQVDELNITNLAMPKIGCGLDRLNWDTVRQLIMKHKPANVNVKVFYL